MKITTVLTIFGSLALTTTTLAAPLPGASSPGATSSQGEKATGTFSYTYAIDDDGDKEAQGRLTDPTLNQCINIPELDLDDEKEDDDDKERAYYPFNRSNAAAVVFTDPDCRGTPFYIPPGEPKHDVAFYFASVKFEPAL